MALNLPDTLFFKIIGPCEDPTDKQRKKENSCGLCVIVMKTLAFTLAHWKWGFFSLCESPLKPGWSVSPLKNCGSDYSHICYLGFLSPSLSPYDTEKHSPFNGLSFQADFSWAYLFFPLWECHLFLCEGKKMIQRHLGFPNQSQCNNTHHCIDSVVVLTCHLPPVSFPFRIREIKVSLVSGITANMLLLKHLTCFYLVKHLFYLVSTVTVTDCPVLHGLLGSSNKMHGKIDRWMLSLLLPLS